MVIDLTSVADLCELGSVLVAILGTWWKFFVSPGRKFRAGIIDRLKAVEDKSKSDMKDFQDNQKLINVQLKEDLKDTEKELTDLKQDVKDHVIKTDQKNDRLLDLLLKYFTEKD